MTITTADRPDAFAVRAARGSAAFQLAPLALAAMLLSAECGAADWTFSPFADLRQTYTDNVGLQSDESGHGQFVSEAAPGFVLTGNSRRLKLNASGQARTYSYLGGDRPGNLANNELQYRAQAQSELVDELFYLDALASQSRQVVSPFGQILGSSYSNANRTSMRTWSISPYLHHRFGTNADLTVRLARDGVEGATGVGFGFGNSTATTRSVDLVSGPHFDKLGWNLNYTRHDEDNSVAGQYKMENSLAGLTWQAIRYLALTANGGYETYDYLALGDRTSGRRWSAGFIWTPSSRTRVQASVGRRYFGKTGALDASFRTRHTVWSAVYSDDVTNTRSQLLLPAAIDTASMLDRLFTSAYPDPVARQQVVQAYIAATGLPPSLADNINFLSNRFVRDKRLQGAATLRGARSDLTLTVYRDERNALSLQQSDSILLGNRLATLNDNVRQKGVTVNYAYRLSHRTTAQAGVIAYRALSLDTNTVNNSQQLSLSVTHALSAKARGSLEVRHSRGSIGFMNGAPYQENAIVAALNVKF
jgi:uncharacterized protein (PEP-CTERM system associated)